MSCGHAHTVGLLPVFGACSITLNRRGLPGLSPVDSTAMTDTPTVNHADRLSADTAGEMYHAYAPQLPSHERWSSRICDHLLVTLCSHRVKSVLIPKPFSGNGRVRCEHPISPTRARRTISEVRRSEATFDRGDNRSLGDDAPQRCRAANHGRCRSRTDHGDVAVVRRTIGVRHHHRSWWSADRSHGGSLRWSDRHAASAAQGRL